MDATTFRLLAVLAATTALLAGCVGPFCARTQRDAKLLSLTTPVAPMAALEVDLRDESTPMPAAMSTEDLADRVEAQLSLPEALRVGLQQSGVARVQAGGLITAGRVTFYDIQANEASVDAALAAFDTTFRTDLFSSIINQPPDAFFGPGIAEPTARDELALNFGWEKQNIWGGTAAAVYNPRPGYLFIPDSTGDSFNPRLVSQLELLVRQPLLRGSGIAVNSAPIQISRIRTEQSAWDFKRTVMASVRSIVTAYWDLHAARVALQSVEDVLPVLEEIVRIQREALKAQWGTYTEVAKAETQLYGFRQAHQALQSDVLENELRLRNLMGMAPNDGQKLVPATAPLDQRLSIDTQQAVRSALDNDPNLVRQRLDVRIRMVEQMLAANGMRCNLDVFALHRMNGIGENLGDSLDQMTSFDFLDWELGASFSVPLGRRQATAELRAADQRLIKEKVLLEQEVFSAQHDLVNIIRAIEFAYREYQEASRRLQSADEWVKGARLRYENPNLDDSGANWLVQNLNEYLQALRFRTEAATDKAAVLAKYNSELVRLEERKGTLLAFFGIDFLADPCRQSAKLPPPPWVTEAPTFDAQADFAPVPQSFEKARQGPIETLPAGPTPQNPPTSSRPSAPDAGPIGDVIHEPDTPPAASPSEQSGKSNLGEIANPPASRDESCFPQLSRLDSLRRLPPAYGEASTHGWGAANPAANHRQRPDKDAKAKIAGPTRAPTIETWRLPETNGKTAATLDCGPAR